jgi:DNA gyrase subunit A
MRVSEGSKVVTIARTAHEEDAVEDALPIDEGDAEIDEDIDIEEEADDIVANNDDDSSDDSDATSDTDNIDE